MTETVSHNGLDTEVYNLHPADYTTTTFQTHVVSGSLLQIMETIQNTEQKA